MSPEPIQTHTLPVSVVILTLNEEVNIAACLESCAWCDDVHVLDSGSKDRTRELAESLGAKVYTNPFKSFGAQRNWAIDNIPLKHDWVFHLDADERFTPEGIAELRRVIEAGPAEAGFHVPSKFMFMGRWLKRSAGYPTYQMRLFHKARVRFIDHGHGQREEPGTVLGTLREPYLHYSFSKGVSDWIEKHNRYSTLEAVQVARDEAQDQHRPSFLRLVGTAFSTGGVERRRALKSISYRVPCRPTLRWMMMVLAQGGILEGCAGLTYASLLAMYEKMIAIKLKLLRDGRGKAAGFEQDIAPGSTPAATPPPTQATSPVPAATLAPTPAQASTAIRGEDIPDASPWTTKQKLVRALWMTLGRPAFGLVPASWHALRRTILRAFGARIGSAVQISPSVSVEVPWNIDLAEGVVVEDGAILYALGPITIGQGTVIGPYAHLCAGTHDHTTRRYPLLRPPITIGPNAMIGCDAYVGPNVRVGARAVLLARASAYKDLAAGIVYAGNPAKPVEPTTPAAGSAS